MSKKIKIIKPNTERIKTFNDMDWANLDEVDFDFDPRKFIKMTKVSQASSSSLINEAEAMDHGGCGDMGDPGSDGGKDMGGGCDGDMGMDSAGPGTGDGGASGGSPGTGGGGASDGGPCAGGGCM